MVHKMKKQSRLLIVTALVIFAIGGSYVFAAGPGNQSSSETSVAVIGQNVEMAVQPSLKVVTKWMGATFDWQESQTTSVYSGQTIGEGELNITNVSPISQTVYLYARPIKINGDVWPAFEVVTKSNGTRVWQIVLQPATSIDLKIEVKVAYGSAVSSPFSGVELIVRAASAPSPSSELG